MEIKNGLVMFWKNKKGTKEHAYVFRNVSGETFDLEENGKILTGSYHKRQMKDWVSNDLWDVTFINPVVKPNWEAVDECHDL